MFFHIIYVFVNIISILNMVILNSWLDNSSIPAMSHYGSHAWSVSSNCVFCLLTGLGLVFFVCLFWKFLFTYTQTQILLSAVSNLLIRPSKHYFLLLHCFLFLSLLKFYLRISIYPLAVHICSSISSMFLLTSLAY